jgi:hypothetical protein
MTVGIRTEALRKVFTSPPPVGGGRAPGGRSGARRAKSAYEVVALDGLTLEVRAGETLMQPMMFVFVFGRVMTTSGFMPPEYTSLLLPGIIAISMVMSGMCAVAMHGLFMAVDLRQFRRKVLT